MTEAGLPREWTRGPQWASEQDKAEWGPVLERAQTAWETTELASLTEGLRTSALVFLTVEELVRAAADCARVGLEVTPLAPAPQGLRAAVHHPGLGASWRAAWAAGDDAAIGDLLGFPNCCREFFLREWRGRGSSDVTRAMSTIEGPWEANILLRWMGVRLVPHLPCSGGCPFTAQQARAYRDAGARAGADVAALEALLRLPVRYHALAGVGIVETPHFRFMFGTDYSPSLEERSRAGQPAPATEAAAAAPKEDEPSSSEDNGFVTFGAMERAHTVVARVVGRVGSALDLGAGDGSLLARLARLGRAGTAAAAAAGEWMGVESDAGRAERGVYRHGPRVSLVQARIQDLASWEGLWEVTLLMPGRLLEMEAAAAAAVRAALRDRAMRVVVYAYGDTLRKHGGLAALAADAGIALHGNPVTGDGVEAAEAVL